MKLQTLKLFNIGGRSQTSHGVCGFNADTIWLVEGDSRINQRGKISTKEIARWWDTYFKTVSWGSRSIEEVLNQGLRELKNSGYGTSSLGVSMAIVREYSTFIEVLVVGDCEVLLGGPHNVVKNIVSKHNQSVSDAMVEKMRMYSTSRGITILDTRRLIESEVYNQTLGLVDEGYYLLRCNDKWLDLSKVDYTKIEKREITHITLLNLGVTQYYRVFNLGSKEELFNYSIRDCYMKIYEKLSEKQYKDSMCGGYPRFKSKLGCILISVAL